MTNYNTSEFKQKLSQKITASYVENQQEGWDLVDCLDTLVSCFEQDEGGKWRLIPRLNYGYAIGEAKKAMANYRHKHGQLQIKKEKTMKTANEIKTYLEDVLMKYPSQEILDKVRAYVINLCDCVSHLEDRVAGLEQAMIKNEIENLKVKI